MTKYAKAIIAVVGAVTTWATTYFPGNQTVAAVVGLASAVATVAAVYLVPNKPS